MMLILHILSFQLFIYVLALLGLYALIIYLVDNLKSLVLIAKSVLSPLFQPQANLSLAERFGSWAIVTGATDGIGKQYCKELAAQGISIVLISRTKEKLLQTSNEIENEYRVKTKWIVADFGKGSQDTYDHIEKELTGIPIGILVNNVGRMYEYPDELDKIPEETLWGLININMAAVTMMCRMLIPKMKKSGKGAIVNISSGSELQPLPYMAVYSASKLYVKSFSLALQNELSTYGIIVQVVTPMYVITKMNEYSTTVMKGGFLIPDVFSYTKSLVFTLGKSNETTGYWTHGIQYAIMKCVPTWVRTIMGQHINMAFRKEYFVARKMKIIK